MDETVKPKKKFRIAMAAVTLLFLLTAGAAAYTVSLLREKEQQCAETSLPEGLSAVETVEKYFEYWDEGNNVGMRLAALPDMGSHLGDDAAFVPGLCWFCDISLKSCKLMEGTPEGYEGCFESAAVSADFTYVRHLGFGDSTIPEDNKDWIFYVARITESDGFKIIAVNNTGFARGGSAE